MSPRGFSLPPGDIAQGKVLFDNFQCVDCHVISGQLDANNRIVLGGKTNKVKTYGELVTAIINPSHELSPRYAKDVVSQGGQSLMRNYNDVMTVSQLIDLVEYLQNEYELVPYRPTEYGYYSVVGQ
jgi:mono/diheme cytochrome c family protein